MFIDLLDKEIQPAELDCNYIPDIEISASLRTDIQKMLQEEEDSFAKVNDKNAIVQTDKNFVFFSNQWLYLAVLCKKYAEALKPYGDFFDENIRGNQEIVKVLAERDYENPALVSLVPDIEDRKRLIRYIEPDATYRPGKALLNGDKLRSVKDIFGSCVLKKIPVPDASSAYLGTLIYYLAKRPDIYNRLEQEVISQIVGFAAGKKLSNITKECAQEIIDFVYGYDGFKRIEDLFEVNEKNVKIDISKTNGLLPNGNYLRYLFARPSSDLYEGSIDKPRVFVNKEYQIDINDESILCRLTTEWVDSELAEGGNGNYLRALIAIVNEYYADVVEIRSEFGERYLYMLKNEFKIDELPEVFKTEYAVRYITSLLAKPFVILTGNSGTGKTRISKQFAEYLEWKSEEGKKNWIMVPVGADWTDNSKILGFYNPIANEGKGKYEKTEIVELIEEANKYTNIPYFLILDEMNLSHVERYFSDFLSHMEAPDTTFNLDGYDGELVYPDNLFVVGTVNIDETTYMFSPKVLDRANVIEFKPEKESVLKLFSEPAVTRRINAVNDGSAEAFLKVARDVRNGKLAFEGYKKDEVDYDLKYVERIFGEVYEIIQENGFEFAYRTVKEIRQYISAAYEIASNNTIDLIEIVDQQILQKVLPKIHGNKKEIGQLLDRLEAFCAEEKLSESEKKITQMKGKLSKVQYASFI